MQQLSRLERPFLIGFRKPIPIEESTASGGVGGENINGKGGGGASGDPPSKGLKKGVSFQQQEHRKSVVGTKFRL